MYVTVEDPILRTLEDRWQFYLRDSTDKLELVFASYSRYQRPSPRHRKWQRVAYWVAKTNQRENTLNKRPEVPQDIIDRALEQVREAITVKLDWT